MHFSVKFDQFPGKLQAIFLMDLRLRPIIRICSKYLGWAENSWDGQQMLHMGSKSLRWAALITLLGWNGKQILGMGSKSFGWAENP